MSIVKVGEISNNTDFTSVMKFSCYQDGEFCTKEHEIVVTVKGKENELTISAVVISGRVNYDSQGRYADSYLTDMVKRSIAAYKAMNPDWKNFVEDRG